MVIAIELVRFFSSSFLLERDTIIICNVQVWLWYYRPSIERIDKLLSRTLR